jgi:hypothetical protein
MAQLVPIVGEVEVFAPLKSCTHDRHELICNLVHAPRRALGDHRLLGDICKLSNQVQRLDCELCPVTTLPSLIDLVIVRGGLLLRSGRSRNGQQWLVHDQREELEGVGSNFGRSSYSATPRESSTRTSTAWPCCDPRIARSIP